MKDKLTFQSFLSLNILQIFDLCEFPPTPGLGGLHIQQSQSISLSPILASQGDQVLVKLKTQPKLRFLLDSDKPVVISPCMAPPSRSNVALWLHQKKPTNLQKDRSSVTKKNNDQGADPQHHVLVKNEASNVMNYSQINFTLDLQDEVNAECHASSKNRHTDALASSNISLDDSSTLIDTELDISCTQFGPTPAPVIGSFLKDKSLFTFTHVRSISGKKRHLSKDSNSSCGSADPLSPFPDSKQFKDSKKCRLSSPLPEDNVCSTPLRRGSRDMFEPACTPINSRSSKDMLDSSPRSDLRHHLKKPIYPETPAVNSRDSNNQTDKTVNIINKPPMRRISTDVDRKNVLASQTQSPFSISGFISKEKSQLEGPTPRNSFGFKVAQDNFQDSKAIHKYQYVTAFSMELHIETRGDLRPDPEYDTIKIIFFSIFDDIPEGKGRRNMTGAIVVDPDSSSVVMKREIFGDGNTFYSTASNIDDPVESTVPIAESDTRYIKANHATLLEKCAVEGLDVLYVQDERQLIDKVVSLILR